MTEVADILIIYSQYIKASKDFKNENPGYESKDFYEDTLREGLPEVSDFPAVYNKKTKQVVVRPATMQDALDEMEDQETKEAESTINNKVIQLLNETDKFLGSDYPRQKFIEIEVQGKTKTWTKRVRSTEPTDEVTTQQILDYRQSLRDISKQEGFPHNITWPERLDI